VEPSYANANQVRDLDHPIAIGGELSAGLSARHHVPEKDACSQGLLCSEAVACGPKFPAEQLNPISNQVGSFYMQRENFRLTPEGKTKFTEKLDPIRKLGAAAKRWIFD